jgi:hypothetical protein
VGVLIGELNELLADGGDGSAAGVAPRLSPPSRSVFEMFPAALQAELLQERDPHGNVQVSVMRRHFCLTGQLNDNQCMRHRAWRAYPNTTYQTTILRRGCALQQICGGPADVDSHSCSAGRIQALSGSAVAVGPVVQVE